MNFKPIYRKPIFFTALCAVFILFSALCLPRLLPWDRTLPDVELLPGQSSHARTLWLDALAFEEIFSASIERFGIPQIQSTYLGGGYQVVGDPRDGTTSPISWMTFFLSPLGRMKFKILLALFVAFFTVTIMARRFFGIGRGASLAVGLFFLVCMGAWPSLVDYPLDAGILWSFPALAILWTNRNRIAPVGIAGIFIALSFWQTGGGILAVSAAVLITGFALRLSPEDARPESPVSNAWLALGFAILFASVKLIPMFEITQPLRVFAANLSQPEVWVSPLNLSFTPNPFSSNPFWGIKFFVAIWAIALWFAPGPHGKAGAMATAIFGIFSIMPDWSSASGSLLGASGLPGIIDSPGRYFYPFFVLFVALGIASGIHWAEHHTAKRWVFLIASMVVVAVSASGLSAHMNKLKWTAPAAPLDFSEYYKQVPRTFFQVRSPQRKKTIARDESWHPAVLASQKVGVIDPPFVDIKSYYARQKFTVYGRPAKIHVAKAYKGPWHTTTRQIELRQVREYANRYIMEVTAIKGGHVVINRNYNPGWKSDKGQVIAYRGLLAVKFRQPGEHTITLVFRPFGYFLGLILTALSLVAYIVFAFPWFLGRGWKLDYNRPPRYFLGIKGLMD